MKLLLTLSLCQWSCGATIERDDTLATIGDVTIDERDLAQLESRLPEEMQPTTSGEEAVRELLRSLVDREIMVMESEALGGGDDPQVKRRLQRKSMAWLKEEVVSRDIGTVSVSDEEIEAAYRSGWHHKVRPAHITTATEKEAWEIYEQVQEGADFAELAREKSTSPDREQGGDLGRYFGMEGTRSPLIRLALSMSVGQISEPIATAEGYELIRINDEVEVPLSQVQEAIHAALLKAKTAEARERLMRVLAQDFGVRYESEGVRAMLRALRDTSGTSVTQIAMPLVHYDHGRELSVGSASQLLLRQRVPLAGLSDSAAVAMVVLRLVLADSLILMRARQQGLDDSDDYRKFVENEQRKLLVNHLRRTQVLDKVEISAEDLRAQYEKNRDEFPVPAQTGIIEVKVRTEEEARDVLALVRDGADMSVLAGEHSMRPSGARAGGHLHVAEGEEEKWGALYEAIQQTPVGAFGGPVAVEGGFSVFTVKERQPTRVRTMDEITPILRYRLTQLRNEEAFENYIVDLRNRYADRVEWRDERIAALGVRWVGFTHPYIHTLPPSFLARPRLLIFLHGQATDIPGTRDHSATDT